mmetsp:Transcript_10283/g.38195  ORF Transcript_10283/g.38195 Transcript_10283/m.38195 type:complete len:105 (+) Transcript_10283:2072-2386(+)
MVPELGCARHMAFAPISMFANVMKDMLVNDVIYPSALARKQKMIQCALDMELASATINALVTGSGQDPIAMCAFLVGLAPIAHSLNAIAWDEENAMMIFPAPVR